MGYTDRSDVGVLIEGWPVQFIPVSSDLDLESIEQHTEIYFDGDSALRIKVLMPEYLVAKAVSVGRLKDLARVEAFLDQHRVHLDKLRAVIERFDLREAFCTKSGRADPLEIS